MSPDRSNCRSVIAALGVVLLLVPVALAVAPTAAVASDDAGNVTLYSADDRTFEDAMAVRAAVENDALAPADNLVVGDTLVVAVESERLARTMADGSGSTTDRFLAALAGEADFRLVQTNPTPNANAKVASVGRENVTVYRDGTTSYVLVRTDALAFRYRTVDRRTDIVSDERFAVQFGYDLGEYDRSDPSGPVVELHPYRSAFDATAYRYDPLSPERVQISVDVEVRPDESLVARLTLDDGRTIATRFDPVEGTGLETAPIDLSGVDPRTGYVLELVHDGEVVDRREGTVREPRATVRDATLTGVDDQLAVRVTVELSHGGVVEVFDEECREVGIERVGPGVERRLTIPLWHESGSKVRTAAAEYGVLVRARRDRTARRAAYPGPDAIASVGFDGSCPAATNDPGPTDGLTTTAPRTGTTTGRTPPTTTASGTVSSSTHPTTPTDRPDRDGTAVDDSAGSMDPLVPVTAAGAVTALAAVVVVARVRRR